MAIDVDLDVDVVVVGAGLMGSASAWQLALRGRAVLLLEQFDPGHRLGSSHGSARIVRRAYSDALYTKLSGRAFELWREAELASSAHLLRMLGALDFGGRRSVLDIDRWLTEFRVEHELLSADAAAERWPELRFRGDVLFHPQAGTVDSALAVETFTALAVALGAEVRYRSPVQSLVASDVGVRLNLVDGSAITAKTVVIAAGAWTGPLLGALVALPPLTVSQQQVFHFARLDPASAPWPSVIHEDAKRIYHLAGGRDGGPSDDRKVGEHGAGSPTTASERSGIVDPVVREGIVAYVKEWLPSLDPTPRGETTCLYTETPSEDFIIDRSGPIVVCSPCSGHGAKFAPLVGELVADVVTGDGASVPPRFRLPWHAVARTGKVSL
jgi:monomeric sarcosine oxidase